MKIYLIYEEHYDPCIEYIDSVTIYPYKSMDGVIQRLIDETGKTKEEIEQDLKDVLNQECIAEVKTNYCDIEFV